MWTPTTRRQHSRAGLRYGSDLTDGEWAIIEPFLPPESACGRKRAWPMREIFNAMCYVLRGGIAWRLMPDSPAAGDLVLLADPGFVAEPEHYVAEIETTPARDRRHCRRPVFLKASTALAAWCGGGVEPTACDSPGPAVRG